MTEQLCTVFCTAKTVLYYTVLYIYVHYRQSLSKWESDKSALVGVGVERRRDMRGDRQAVDIIV